MAIKPNSMCLRPIPIFHSKLRVTEDSDEMMRAVFDIVAVDDLLR